MLFSDIAIISALAVSAHAAAQNNRYGSGSVLGSLNAPPGWGYFEHEEQQRKEEREKHDREEASRHGAPPFQYYDMGRGTNQQSERSNSSPKTSGGPYDYYDRGQGSSPNYHPNENSSPRSPGGPYDYYDKGQGSSPNGNSPKSPGGPFDYYDRGQGSSSNYHPNGYFSPKTPGGPYDYYDRGQGTTPSPSGTASPKTPGPYQYYDGGSGQRSSPSPGEPISSTPPGQVYDSYSNPISSSAPGVAPGQKGPNLSSFTQQTWIPFTNDSQGMGESAPMLNLRFPGKKGVLPTVMDTGSTGFTLSYADMKGWYQGLKKPEEYPPGKIYLSSSKVLKWGRWVPLEVELADSPGTKAQVNVLAITRKAICKEYSPMTGVCPKEEGVVDMPPNINYLGVGFDREGDGMSESTPDKNLLLNVTTINGQPVQQGTYNQGYIVTKDGIHLGLTPQDTAGFKWHKLEKRSDKAMDWNMAKMCIRVQKPQGHKQPPKDICAKGYILVDTGVPQMYLTMPKDWPEGIDTQPVDNISNQGAKSKDLIKNTVVKMHIPHCGHWHFIKGNNDPTEPQAVYTSLTNPNKRPPFVNTGRRFLREHDVAYDAISGWFGIHFTGAGGGQNPEQRPPKPNDVYGHYWDPQDRKWRKRYERAGPQSH